MRVLRWIPSILLLLPWLWAPLVPSNEARIRDAAAPASFRLLDWETIHLGERAGRLWSGLFSSTDEPTSDAQTLRAYFGAPVTARAALRTDAEAALERMVADAYRAGGLAQQNDGRLFPPVLVALTAPPNVLVIAPRNELRVVESSVLQGMDIASQEQLEASADSTGMSSLVAPIGGLATYPAMVLEDDSAERVLTSVAHEWLHQYLIFYPLGADYWNSQETREINETTAEMVGAEVGGGLARQHNLTLPPAGAASGQSAFDFRAFMRETRVQTELLLKAGQIDAAEAYMRQRRDELRPHGYNIRKLNQAYFALYGSYGEGFAASPANPIPALLRTMRERSGSLGEFVLRMRGVTNVAELRRAAG